jgi:hypothetical protein
MKRAPWVATSVAIHALLLGVLYLTVVERVPVRQVSTYGIASRFEEAEPNLPESGGPEDLHAPESDPADLVAPELDEPEKVEPPPFPSPLEEAAPPAPAMPEPDETAEPAPEVIGPSVRALAGRRKAPERPTAAPPPSPQSDETVHDDPDQEGELNRRAAARVRDEIARGGSALGRALKGLRREDVLVVRGSFDHMESVLEALRVPYTVKTPFEVADDPRFSAHRVVFWNCGEVTVPPRALPPLYDGIRAFVQEGGYLFTSDWAIETVLTHAFPGYVATSGKVRPLREDVLEVRPAAAASGHRLLEGTFDPEVRAKWWLEATSYDVLIVKDSAVEVLIECPALARMKRSPVVAATFNHGRGRVLHVLGHYYQQKGNVAGTMGVQRLALNFVKMRLDQGAGGAR